MRFQTSQMKFSFAVFFTKVRTRHLVDIRFLMRRIRRGIKEVFLSHTIKAKLAKTAVMYSDVPYFSQWESRELIGSILNMSLSADRDPLWSESGASSAAEYAWWSPRLCGMACLKMILAHSHDEIYPIIFLAKQSLKYGVYNIIGNDRVDGMFYRPFCDFVLEEYGLLAQGLPCMIIEDIFLALETQHYVLASVHAQIRDPSIPPPGRGGHLVLVVGYDRIERVLFIHNPAAGTISSQSFAKIKLHDFAQSFDYKGIIVSMSSSDQAYTEESPKLPFSCS